MTGVASVVILQNKKSVDCCWVVEGCLEISHRQCASTVYSSSILVIACFVIRKLYMISVEKLTVATNHDYFETLPFLACVSG